MFGDADKYVSMSLFLPTGEINSSCYEDHLGDAPIACLTKRCLQRFTWLGLLGLNQGGSFYSADTFKMLGYLVLRCLFGASMIFMMTSMLDKMEAAIYKVVGKPEVATDFRAGFSGKAGDAIRSGASAGLSAGKFAVSSMKAAVAATGFLTKTFGQAALAVVSAIPFLGRAVSAIGGIMRNSKNYIQRQVNNIKTKITNGINKIRRNISNGFAKIFNTTSYQNHVNRLNHISQQRNNAIQQNNMNARRSLEDYGKLHQNILQNNAKRVEDYEKNLRNKKDEQGNSMYNDKQIADLVNEKRNELHRNAENAKRMYEQNVERSLAKSNQEIEYQYEERVKHEDDNW